eukprot:scaffold6691_cov358-Prasinococcus_capsulatus_cf.AAC.15
MVLQLLQLTYNQILHKPTSTATGSTTSGSKRQRSARQKLRPTWRRRLGASWLVNEPCSSYASVSTPAAAATRPVALSCRALRVEASRVPLRIVRWGVEDGKRMGGANAARSTHSDGTSETAAWR